MRTLPVFVGIDVACAKRRRLPICFAALDDGRLKPLELPQSLTSELPLGTGNGEIAERHPFRAHVQNLVTALERIEVESGWQIVRVAIDAPAAPPPFGVRESEQALRKETLSCIQTPSVTAWAKIRDACVAYLQDGGALNRLPYANMIWMLYGFEIFRVLRAQGRAEVIEVYPQAIVRRLLGNVCPHKSTESGYRKQLDVIAKKTQWSVGQLEAALARAVPGTRHDRLDAFMSAWVASLERKDRRAYGRESDPDDAIWIPS
jgi:predicted nuclease with RNAse H fold